MAPLPAFGDCELRCRERTASAARDRNQKRANHFNTSGRDMLRSSVLRGALKWTSHQAPRESTHAPARNRPNTMGHKASQNRRTIRGFLLNKAKLKSIPIALRYHCLGYN